MRHNRWRIPYAIFIASLAIISIILVFMDYLDQIQLMQQPYFSLDLIIWVIFVADYSVRLYLAHDKRQFFKANIFDLLAILPFNFIFTFFRIGRLAELGRLFKLSRLIGLSGKLQHSCRKFLKTNGFIYLLYISLTVLIISSVTYAIAEHVTLGQAFWWAASTASTVGYGDIAPQTVGGKIAAILLMLVGIGFITTLTSAITNFFSDNTDTDRLDALISKIDQLQQKNDLLEEKLTKIQETLQNKNN